MTDAPDLQPELFPTRPPEERLQEMWNRLTQPRPDETGKVLDGKQPLKHLTREHLRAIMYRPDNNFDCRFAAEYRILQHFDKVDKDHDGKVTYNDFCAEMRPTLLIVAGGPDHYAYTTPPPPPKEASPARLQRAATTSALLGKSKGN